MKFFIFVCAGLTDEPVEDLGGRTPFEVAKTPVMDELAKKGRVESVSFVPSNLEPLAEVAVLSLLGYDPQQFYTGLAPLEAPAFGIRQDDREVIFRADLTTASDGVMVDRTSGGISDREADILITGLSTAFADQSFRFCRGRGYKNYLLVRDEKLLEDLDELDCVSPSFFLGQKISKFLPKGRGNGSVVELMKKADTYLENQEINRVRIDLGENPANGLWLWGQGKKPRLQSFEKQHGLSGAFFADADFIKGLAEHIGLLRVKDPTKLPTQSEVVFFYYGSLEAAAASGLKQKIKKIEDFDVFVGTVLKSHSHEPSLRVCVCGDVSESLSRKTATRNPTIALIAGEGIAADKNLSFDEKTCGLSSLADRSDGFLSSFLKS